MVLSRLGGTEAHGLLNQYCQPRQFRSISAGRKHQFSLLTFTQRIIVLVRSCRHSDLIARSQPNWECKRGRAVPC